MNLPAVGDRCFLPCASGSLVCISNSMVSMVQMADRELLKNPGVTTIFRSVCQIFKNLLLILFS